MFAFTPSLPLSSSRATVQVAPKQLTCTTKMVLSERESRRQQVNDEAKLKNSTKPTQIPAHLLKNKPTKPMATPKTIPLRITGNNISVTESLRLYITDKLSKVMTRYDHILTKIDVHLAVEHNPSIANKNKIEVVVFIGKTILRSEFRSDDMYSAIDNVQNKILRVIRKFKERRDSKHHHKSNMNSNFDTINLDGQEVLDDLYQDEYNKNNKEIVPGIPVVNEIVRRKVFPMPLQSVEEAVLCCEYVDHPWYLFRNAETKQICLVYKRNHGGYGLIEPSNPDGVDEEQIL